MGNIIVHLGTSEPLENCMQNSGNVPTAKIEVKNSEELDNFQRKYFGSRLHSNKMFTRGFFFRVIQDGDSLVNFNNSIPLAFSEFCIFNQQTKTCWFPRDIEN